jgi:hypothetical protein
MMHDHKKGQSRSQLINKIYSAFPVDVGEGTKTSKRCWFSSEALKKFGDFQVGFFLCLKIMLLSFAMFVVI